MKLFSLFSKNKFRGLGTGLNFCEQKHKFVLFSTAHYHHPSLAILTLIKLTWTAQQSPPRLWARPLNNWPTSELYLVSTILILISSLVNWILTLMVMLISIYYIWWMECSICLTSHMIFQRILSQTYMKILWELISW